MSNTGFVPVLEQEIPALAQMATTIWHECFSSILTPEQIDYMVDRFQSEKAMRAQIAHEGYEYFFACLDGTPCGYVGIQAKEGKVYLSKLYLLPAARGSGLGADALQFVQQAAKERDCTHVWLTVNRHNARAIAAYQKAGMQMIRTQVTDIGNGFVMDDYVFEIAVS